MFGLSSPPAGPADPLPLDPSESDSCLELRSASAASDHLRWVGRPRAARVVAVAGLLVALLLVALALPTKTWQLGILPHASHTGSVAGSTEVLNEVAVKASSCKSSKKWCESGEVGLFCFSQIVSGGYEEQLVKLQLKRGVSIFACDDFAVTCAHKIPLGKTKAGDEVHTLVNPATGRAAAGNKQSGATVLNVVIFMKAWQVVIESGKVWSQDWTVKVDPDAVFFPERAREHLKPRTGAHFPMTYTLNCREKHWKQDDAAGNGHYYDVPKLYGAMEVFNMKALGAYKDTQKVCRKNLPWHTWGEDLFLRRCMELMKATKLVDYEQVGDHRCPGNPPSHCRDGNRPAYHPHKTIRSWFTCYNESLGLRTTAPGLAPSKNGKSTKKSAGTAKPWKSCGGAGKAEMECTPGWKCVHKSQYFWQCLQGSSSF